MKYEVIIGLEIHVETKSKTKMFSGAPTSFNAPPNSQVHVIDMAFPGTLPAVNKKAVQNAIMLSHALNMTIDRELHFDRKNYYYSDLPKGYQITQERRPIGTNGLIEIVVGDQTKSIRIERLHMEEDTAKQMHLADVTLIDYNRAGAPLVEIVTKPDLRSGEEAMAFVETIREIVTFTGVGDGKMEEGSLRCDVNISLRPVGIETFGTKVEIKNLNSISNIGKVIDIEIKRQTAELDAGRRIVSDTRRYDEALKDTITMRLKDNAIDYKYFREGNIAPITLSEAFIADVIAKTPELPATKRKHYLEVFNLTHQDISILLQDIDQTNYFDIASSLTTNYRTLINWLNGEVSAYLNKEGIKITALALRPENLAKLVNLVSDGKLSNAQARELFSHIAMTNEDPETKAKALNLVQVSDTDFILKVINEVIDENLSVIDDIKAGKDRAMGFLVGQVMKKTGGKVNPGVANTLMRQEIAKR